MDPNLRNLKDFLTLYNKVTELCFNRCVDNMNERDLAKHEETCVNRCVNKFALFNQNMMKVYVEVQSEINQKRLQEIEEGQKVIQQNQEQQQQAQQSPSNKSTIAEEVKNALTSTPKLLS
ncbi:mitochondrial import inner membrane translocase subunit Tim10B [Musca domestica]|uniref:Mitochondrial import inner membrane translocase subunit n=1 Tax=Musca domestica TaxID=7370 RepID=A0A9J7I741_MUSDO|nr:mitochondrial import inner membrane translocase subunit Tim10B [Musca domestica]